MSLPFGVLIWHLGFPREFILYYPSHSANGENLYNGFIIM